MTNDQGFSFLFMSSSDVSPTFWFTTTNGVVLVMMIVTKCASFEGKRRNGIFCRHFLFYRFVHFSFPFWVCACERVCIPHTEPYFLWKIIMCMRRIKSWHQSMNAIIYQCSTFMKDTLWLCTRRPQFNVSVCMRSFFRHFRGSPLSKQRGRWERKATESKIGNFHPLWTMAKFFFVSFGRDTHIERAK